MARFQARSAYCTVGFTTSESENVVQHPVRRRIIMILMFAGNIGFVSIVVAAVNSLGSTSAMPLPLKLVILLTTIGALLVISSSRWLDNILFHMIAWALKKFTQLEVYDYHALLRLHEGYYVTTLFISESDWLVGHSLNDLRLSDIGINVLGIGRSDGSFVGSPVGSDYIRKGDTLIVYGSRENIEFLDRLRKRPEGRQHYRNMLEARNILSKKFPATESRGFLQHFFLDQESWMAGQSLATITKAHEGPFFLAIEKSSGEYLILPPEGYVLEAGDRLSVLGDETVFRAMRTSENAEEFFKKMETRQSARKSERG